MNNPIPSTEIVDQKWLKEEIEEWKGIQEMTNESQQHEEDKVLHRTWSNDTPYLLTLGCHVYLSLVMSCCFGQCNNYGVCKDSKPLH